jgi:hypothetical protein
MCCACVFNCPFRRAIAHTHTHISATRRRAISVHRRYYNAQEKAGQVGAARNLRDGSRLRGHATKGGLWGERTGERVAAGTGSESGRLCCHCLPARRCLPAPPPAAWTGGGGRRVSGAGRAGLGPASAQGGQGAGGQQQQVQAGGRRALRRWCDVRLWRRRGGGGLRCLLLRLHGRVDCDPTAGTPTLPYHK